MNIAETRSEMLAGVTALQKKLAGVSDPVERSRLVERTKRQIERIKKRFKQQIDGRLMNGQGAGSASLHEREGIEAELIKATAVALASVERGV